MLMWLGMIPQQSLHLSRSLLSRLVQVSVKISSVIVVAISVLINAFRSDRVFAPVTYQSCDLLGTEVLSQVTLNRHLNLRGKLSCVCNSQKALIDHLVSLFVTITARAEVAMTPDWSYSRGTLNNEVSPFRLGNKLPRLALSQKLTGTVFDFQVNN